MLYSPIKYIEKGKPGGLPFYLVFTKLLMVAMVYPDGRGIFPIEALCFLIDWVEFPIESSRFLID
ncbi:hypothetical protein GCM10008967_06800 [Bacillus carboniphilus]|uniref:Transposase n=1 Tax=Bacillus carboniphilus TaxID=86663 RepID=A0ABN0VW91_9BACI